MSPAASPRKGAATDRRVRRTQRALREAFIGLVLERGYDAVTIEDITDRADVARATFYAHYEDKEQLLAALFEELTTEVTDRMTQVEHVPEHIRTDIVTAFYEHAAEYRDLYRVCLSGAGSGRPRAAYVDLIARGAATVFTERIEAGGLHPRTDVADICRMYAGAHTALLSTWLEDDRGRTPQEMASIQVQLLSSGAAWALGMVPDDIAEQLPRLDRPAPVPT